MTLPATESCGAAEAAVEVAVAEVGSAVGVGFKGVVDDGRDQPGPELLRPVRPAVSLVVTRREWEALVCRAGFATDPSKSATYTDIVCFSASAHDWSCPTWQPHALLVEPTVSTSPSSPGTSY